MVLLVVVGALASAMAQPAAGLPTVLVTSPQMNADVGGAVGIRDDLGSGIYTVP
jgi:hypothetical protein